MIRDVLVPAYSRLHEYIAEEYLDATRDSVGLSALPDGKPGMATGCGATRRPI
jgi:uncharacterized protein (DUF885 family)